jgi:hypothetical protein
LTYEARIRKALEIEHGMIDLRARSHLHPHGLCANVQISLACPLFSVPGEIGLCRDSLDKVKLVNAIAVKIHRHNTHTPKLIEYRWITMRIVEIAKKEIDRGALMSSTNLVNNSLSGPSTYL